MEIFNGIDNCCLISNFINPIPLSSQKDLRIVKPLHAVALRLAALRLCLLRQACVSYDVEEYSKCDMFYLQNLNLIEKYIDNIPISLS